MNAAKCAQRGTAKAIVAILQPWNQSWQAGCCLWAQLFWRSWAGSGSCPWIRSIHVPSLSDHQVSGFGSILRQRGPCAPHGQAFIFSGFRFPCSSQGSSASPKFTSHVYVGKEAAEHAVTPPSLCAMRQGEAGGILPALPARAACTAPAPNAPRNGVFPLLQASRGWEKPWEEIQGGQTRRRRVLKDIYRH